MTITQPLISICIPTFNRKNELRGALSIILSQISSDDNDYEIVVSDNASDDGTPFLIKEHFSQYKSIKYFRNKTNKGMDFNVLQCIKHAKGRYIFFLSDDDILIKGALLNIKNLLIDNSPSCAFLNHYVYNIFTKKKGSNFKKVKHNLIFNDHNQFFSFLSIHSIWISGVIIKRSLINLKNLRKYFGSLALHWYVFLNVATNGNCLFISKLSAVSIHSNKKNRYNMINYRIKMNTILLDYYRRGVYDKYKTKNIKFAIFKQIVKGILIYKANKDPLLKPTIDKLKIQYSDYLPFWIILFPLYIIPNIFFVYIKRIKLFFAKLY